MRFGLSARRLSATLFILAASALFPLAATHAYVGQNPYIVTLDGPRSVRCDAVAQITATVRSSETGELVPGQFVHWDITSSPSSADGISPARAVTNGQGQATARVTFGPAEGKRVVRVRVVEEFPEKFELSCSGGLPIATAPPTVRPPTRTPTPEPPENPDPTPTEPGRTPDGTPDEPTPVAPTNVPATPGGPGDPQLTPEPGAATARPVAVATAGAGGGRGVGESPAPGDVGAGLTEEPGAAVATPAGGAQATTPPSWLPGGADMTLLAAVAAFGAGLVVLGVVLVRRR